MRPAWRLAITSAWRRRVRNALLVGAVALSAALIAAVSSALASANNAITVRMDRTFGAAELRLSPAGRGGTMPASIADEVRTWPEIEAVAPRLSRDMALYVQRDPWLLDEKSGVYARTPTPFRVNAIGIGVDPEAEQAIRPIRILAGRAPQAANEIVLDATLAGRLTWEGSLAKARKLGVVDRPDPLIQRPGDEPVPDPITTGEPPADAGEAEVRNRLLGIRLGDDVVLRKRFFQSETFTVVGMSEPPPLGGRPQAFLTLEGVRGAFDQDAVLSQIDLKVAPGVDPQAIADARKDDVPAGALLQTTERITSGLNKNMKSSQLGLFLAIMLALLSAAFIILTGLGTNVAERQRELGMLRCIGASRGQIAEGQLVEGLLIGVIGATLGVPLGIAIAASGAWYFREVLPTGLHTPIEWLALAFFGSIAAGLLGALWPAIRAARTSPLEAMAARARSVRIHGVLALLTLGLGFVAAQLLLVGLPDDGQFIFWTYALAGLPLMFVGYFLLGPPLVLLVSRVLSPALSALLGLPPRLLARSVRATPNRFGFTAGALMTGLALMISNWITGGAILRDWLGKIEFPDAFVNGLNLSEESKQALDELPFVEQTCAVTLLPVRTDAFGVRAIQSYQTTFVAFEPEPFFDMTRVVWVQGNQEDALAKLEEGNAILVAREFLVAQGLGLGDTFRCTYDDATYEFEIAGVITSPGLEIVSQFFNSGEDLAKQAIHAVFGTRADLKRLFNSDAVNLIQIDLQDGYDDELAVREIRETLFGAGILDAGSGRQIKQEIQTFAGSTLLVFAAVAVMAMLVACFGVANLIVAGIEARRYEFGVLRSIGATRRAIGRLVLGEAVLVAITAMILGTALGTQSAWAGKRLYALLVGLEFELRPPWPQLFASWGLVLVLTLLAATPAVARLARRRPLDLLAARGS
ncbi:MAG: FtsX-like permease family protein [Planctomycetota bacterium]